MTASGAARCRSKFEVGRCGPGPFQGLVHDHVHQDVPGAAVFHGCSGVPLTGMQREVLVQQDPDVPPRQMSHSLWDIWIPVRLCGRERTHVVQVATG